VARGKIGCDGILPFLILLFFFSELFYRLPVGSGVIGVKDLLIPMSISTREISLDVWLIVNPPNKELLISLDPRYFE
jgi:hypothetical protein